MTTPLSKAQQHAIRIAENEALGSLGLIETTGMTIQEFRDLVAWRYIVDAGRISECRPLEPGEPDDITWIINFEKEDEPPA